MDTRVTGTHYGNDLVSNVESSHGVRLSGGSTGGRVDAIGDDANVTLTMAGKGTAAVVLGNSSSPVTLAGKATGGVTVGSSGSSMSEIRKFTVEFTAPVLSSGLTSAAESTFTVAGVSTGTVLIFTPTNTINALYTWAARCSTVNELVMRFAHNGISTLGTGESTNRGVLLQFRF